ncbi:MAG: hypothetical protein U5R06_06285 [candidate division KSB1 bacterium]|nr:hypothetical protein [candidate division KSB1 bacterium]
MNASDMIDVLERRIDRAIKKLLEQKHTIKQLKEEKAEIERRLYDKNRQIALLKQELSRPKSDPDSQNKQELLRDKIKEMIDRIDHVDSS